MKYKCKICGYVFEGDLSSLPEDWQCPQCGVPKSYFETLQPTKRKIVKIVDAEDSQPIHIKVATNSVSLARDEDLCVHCGSCKNACKAQGVYGRFNPAKIKEQTICIDCGQCTLACPTGAINFKNDVENVKKQLKNKQKTIIFQIAPAVRVALGEEFGLKNGQNCEGKIVAALKSLGADYVFDTTFGADLTIMEEATELVERLRKQEKNKNDIMSPMFTSCCPAWVKFAEMFYPQILPNLSTAKSPILMQGAIIKTYFAKLANLEAKDIVSIAIAPCTAKKFEIKRKEMCASGVRDVDYVLTVRELAEFLKQENIDFAQLSEENFDSPLGKASGGGLIFGKSGGVMESALRTAYYLLTGENLKEDILFAGEDGIKEATVNVQGRVLHLAVVSGSANAHNILNRIKNGEHFDFVEVMACAGGCLAGGGTPKDGSKKESVIASRKKALTEMDKNSFLRYAHQNSEILQLYKEFLIKPCSPLAKKLLHTAYNDRSDALGE